jgi:hypothetical protein
MAPLGYIEVLDPKGRVTERHAVGSFPITIGRAYTNHIILDDPFVGAEHVTITRSEEGALIADDLGSVNGLRDGAHGSRVARLSLQSGTVFRVGHTLLRYSAVDQPVQAALEDRASILAPFAAPYAALAIGFGVLAFLALSAFLESYERVTAVQILSEPLVTLSFIVVWAGFWSLASRIVLSRFYFAQHFTLACAAIFGSLALNTAASWIEFFFPPTEAFWFSSIFGSGLLLVALIYGHLGFASTVRSRYRLAAALSVSVVVVGLGVLVEYAGRGKFSTEMEYSGIVKPVDANWLPANSIDQFMRGTKELKKDLDILADKARAGQ